jgi:hypothetical protein
MHNAVTVMGRKAHMESGWESEAATGLVKSKDTTDKQGNVGMRHPLFSLSSTHGLAHNKQFLTVALR